MVCFNILFIAASVPFYKSLWFITIILLVIFASLFLILQKFMTKEPKNNKYDISLRVHEDYRIFLVNASHELRTPLTLIIGPLEKVLGSMSKDDLNYSKIQRSYKQALHMQTLLDTILATDPEGSHISRSVTYQSFNNWVKNVLDDFVDEATERSIYFRTEFDQQIGLLNFDDAKCQIVLSNLILNAINRNPDNSEIRVWTEPHPERASVRVSISDRGETLKKVDVDKLFNLVYSQTEDNHGMNIGLSYSKKIIDSIQGLMSAYTNSHGGATFYFEIPAVSQEDAPAAKNGPITEGFDNLPKYVNPSQAKDVVVDPAMVPFDQIQNVPDIVIDLKSANILVVEDDDDLRNYLQEELSDTLNNVFTAANGVEAVSILKKESINVIVSDIMMPEMDGYALCRYVKTTVSVSHIPVILLTARSDENSRLLGYKNGADDYITKPFNLDALKDSIQKLFFSREAVRRKFMDESEMPTAEESTFSSADEQFLKRFEKLVSDNISKPELDTKFLVDNMGMSRTVLFNKVKQLTGMNLQNYVNKVRMEYVIRLMNSTNLPLGEIAEKAGFSSPRYFSTSFKNYTGVTPTQYKKDHR